MSSYQDIGIGFKEMMDTYGPVLEKIVSKVKELAANPDQATPGEFLMYQFMVSRGTQVFDSMSNLLATIISSINNSIRNQRSS